MNLQARSFELARPGVALQMRKARDQCNTDQLKTTKAIHRTGSVVLLRHSVRTRDGFILQLHTGPSLRNIADYNHFLTVTTSQQVID